nr:helicase, C-terminal [Tanacetum cinerariifolium]
MIMEDGGTAYEWNFDDLDTYVNVTADDFDDDINMDIESLLSIFYASQPANLLQNGVANPSLSIGPCSEPSSNSADEHFGTNDGNVVGSFIFSSLDQSGVSTSGTVCSGDSFDAERKVVDFGFTKLESLPDVVSSPSLCERASPVLGNGSEIVGFSNWDGDHDSSTTLNQSRSDTQSSEKSCFESDMSIKKEFIYMKEDIESKVTECNKIGSFTQKNDQQATVSLDDHDLKICNLEYMSQPAPKKQCQVHGKSIVTAQLALLGPPMTQMGFNKTRLMTNDEQLIYRAALQDLSQPKSEATPPDGALAVPLLRHQRIALSWMVQKETESMHCFGGILADDQGLGKTISTIALILKERSPPSNIVSLEKKKETSNLQDDDDDDEDEVVSKPNKSNQKTKNPIEPTRSRAGTLVVCPTSVIRQWNDELHNKVSAKYRLSVLLYHGKNRTKDPLELAKYDVVLTTYAIVSMEVPKQLLANEDFDETKKHYDFHPLGISSTKKRKYSKKGKKEIQNKLSEPFERPLAKVKWFRVVLDEAQSIKNHKTQVARACWGLKGKRRWCLSGTPIQNVIDDLYSYFRFLRYDPYDVYTSFCSTIKDPIQKNPVNGYKKLQAVLQTIMLRRTK